MGKLETTIILHDKFSDQLNKINKSIQSTVNAMNRINGLSLGNVTSESKRLNTAKRVTSELNKQNAALSKQNTLMHGIKRMASEIRAIGTVAATLGGLGVAVRMSDRMTMADARMNLVAGGDSKAKADLEAKSFAAAQRSTTDYLNFTQAVGKLGILAGDKFKNNDSIVRFVELMNKSFQISGAETSERNAAMLQITQAIASNRLQGDEFRSILENAPMVMQALTKSLGVGHDQLKKMAKEGQITADVLIKAMFDAGEKIEEMYGQLDMTWERHWAKLKNVYTLAFKPIQEQMKKLFNSEQFQSVMNGIGTALIVTGNVVGKALGLVFSLLNKITGLFERFPFLLTVLQGVLAGLGVAFGVFLTAQLIGVGQSIIGWIMARREAFLYQLALFKMAVAQYGLNAAIAMCPITWFLYAIIAVVTVFYLAIAAVNHFAKTSISATGIIAGAFMWLVGLLWNLIWGVVRYALNMLSSWANSVITFAEVVYNAFSGGFTGWIDGVKAAFWAFVNWIYSKIKPLIQVWDDLKGTNYASKLQTSIDSKITAGATSNYKKFNRVDLAGALSGSLGLDYANLSGMYNKGYKWGSNLENSIGKLTKVTLNGQQLTADALNGINDTLGDVGGNTGDTAKNTGDTAKNTASKYEQDYSYLRNWAYQAGMGGSIGYNIKIEQNNKNNIGSNMDLNRVVDAVRDAIIEGILTQAEGVR